MRTDPRSVGISSNAGYDVVLEGILSLRSYGEVVRRLFAAGGRQPFLYSFDLHLEETLRRHRTRGIEARFTEDDMREWYPHARPWGHDQERLIPPTAPAETTAARIGSETGLC